MCKEIPNWVVMMCWCWCWLLLLFDAGRCDQPVPWLHTHCPAHTDICCCSCKNSALTGVTIETIWPGWEADSVTCLGWVCLQELHDTAGQRKEEKYKGGTDADTLH